MKYLFAALFFSEDKNLADRGYWYLCPFPVRAGDRVIAPVGAHNRLQAARVGRTLEAEEANAPYDLRLIKRVTAKYGARKLTVGEAELLEFGGVRYDDRHYTAFGQLFLSREDPEKTQFCGYGIAKSLQTSAADPALYREIARSAGGVLLFGGEGEAAFRRLYAFLRGEEELGLVDGGTRELIREKLC